MTVRTKPWKVTWRGKTWTEDDVTGQHFAVLSMMAGRDDISMLDLNPGEYDPATGEPTGIHGLVLMMIIRMFITVDLAESIGEDDDATDALVTAIAEATAEVSAASFKDEIVPALAFTD